MHNLSASFVLAYHGCKRETGEKLLANEPFEPSTNNYDWLGSGVYFWETNPDRAFDWATERADRKQIVGSAEPFVVGAAIDLGFCLDLMTMNGISLVERAHDQLREGWRFARLLGQTEGELPKNDGGPDLYLRKLDCAVINFLHHARERNGEQPFDTVRGVFTEGKHIYENSGFRRKTHIQICVRNVDRINGVFRVPKRHFTNPDLYSG